MNGIPVCELLKLYDCSLGDHIGEKAKASLL
jgi:hypothetical protein